MSAVISRTERLPVRRTTDAVWPVTAALLYLGLATALPQYLDPSTELVSVAFGVALLLGWVGWKEIAGWPGLRAYLALSLLAATTAGLSGLSAWDFGSLFESGAVGVWFVLAIPGLAGLLQHRANRQALVLGIAVGTAVYGVVAAIRIASGEPVLDASGPNDLLKTIFGLNRNGVNMRAIIVLPFVASWARSRWTSPARWLLLVSVAFVVFATGGRSGLVAIGVLALFYPLVQPGTGRKTRTLLLVVLVGVTGLTMLRDWSAPVDTGIDRLTAYVHGEKTPSDEARELLVRKSWAIAKENPVFGIGLGNFEGRDHPILQEARTPRIEHIARVGVAHNAYAQSLAEIGFVGSFALFALFASIVFLGIRHSAVPSVRLATTALVGLLVMRAFDSGFGAVLYLPLALVLGAVSELSGHQEAPEPEVSRE